MIRGFDYYDWVVFEMFDNNPENPRALFWGWRYNWLASIFWIKEDIPAVGMAPGDETMRIFLEHWWILKNLQKQKDTYFLPLLDENLFLETQILAKKLRSEWKNILLGLSVKKLVKALKFAEKNNIENIIIFWEQEAENNEFIIKNLTTSKENIFKI